MKRMHSKGEIEDIINDSELAEQVNELAAVYTYEDLTLTEAQYTELTSTGSVQIDLSEDPDILARLHNANVVTIYTNPNHTGKVIIAQRQTLTATKATFTALENDNSTLEQYAMDVNLIVEGEGGAVNIGLAEIAGGTKLYRHDIVIGTYTPGPGLTGSRGIIASIVTNDSEPYSHADGRLANASATYAFICSRIKYVKTISGSTNSYNVPNSNIISATLTYNGTRYFPDKVLWINDNSELEAVYGGRAGLDSDLSSWADLPLSDTVHPL